MTAELTIETPATAKPQSRPPMLHVDDIRVAYGESVVIEGASLEIKPGQVVCLMGRNGVGKTTMMKAIMGTLPIRSGSITLRGEDVHRWPPFKRARAGIGYTPQGRGIFPYLTVLENLLMGLEPMKGKDDGQLDEMFTLFPVLNSMSGRTAGLLSGGQQQQLSIARALMGRPTLLLLDEPTEGIQPSIVEEIEQVIVTLKGTLAILLVEQFLDFALAVADHCYVMEQGRTVIDGPPSTLDETVLRQYLSV